MALLLISDLARKKIVELCNFGHNFVSAFLKMFGFVKSWVVVFFVVFF